MLIPCWSCQNAQGLSRVCDGLGLLGVLGALVEEIKVVRGKERVARSLCPFHPGRSLLMTL